MDRPKRTSRKKVAPEPVTDEHHSHETPPCNLVVQVVKDVIPPAAESDAPTSQSSLLGTLVLQYMLDERRNQTTIKRKPKKKRKRKNKGVKVADEPVGSSDAADTSNNGSTIQQRPKSPIQTQQPQAGTSIAAHTSPVVAQWLDRLDEWESSGTISKPTRTLDAFCQSLRCSKPHLLANDISKALALATCVRCRAAAESYWQSTGVPMQDLGLVPGDFHTEKIVLEAAMIDPEVGNKRSSVIPIFGELENDADIERAFDYHAMEEGLLSRNQKSELSQEKRQSNEIVVLEPVVDSEGKIEAIQVSSVLDAVSVARLVRQIILPCGLIELEHPNAVPLTDEQLSAIEDHVTQHEQRMNTQIADLRERKTRAQALFDAASVNTSQTTNYGVKEATALTDCDKECDQLLSAFVAILLQITTLTDGLPDAKWAHFRTKWLWDSYHQGVKKIFKQSLLHEHKLLQLANRPGVVPQMFMNAAHRSSFYEVVKEKHRVLDAFYATFFSTLQDETEKPDGPRFLQRLMTYEPFVNGSIVKDANAWFNQTAIDSACMTLMESYGELIRIVRSSQLSEVQKVQEEKCARLYQVLENCDTVLTQEYNDLDSGDVEQGQFDELRNEWKQLVAHYKSFLPRRNGQVDHVQHFDANFDAENGTMELIEMREQLISMSINMISQWRCLRWVRSQSVEAPVPPLRLMCLMNKDHDEATVPSGNGSTSCCDGGGGKRRFACVLASLLFQWLIVQCNEWHADLTQSELLESMGIEIENATSSTTTPTAVESKNSNKKGKKKKNHSPTTSLPLITETLEETKSVDSSDSDMPFAVAPLSSPPAIKTFLESTKLVTCQPQGNINGIHTAAVEFTNKNETVPIIDSDYTIAAVEPDSYDVTAKKGRRSKADHGPKTTFVEHDVVQPLPNTDNNNNRTQTQPTEQLKKEKDGLHTKKPRDRQRKPIPIKDGPVKASVEIKDSIALSPNVGTAKQRKQPSSEELKTHDQGRNDKSSSQKSAPPSDVTTLTNCSRPSSGVVSSNKKAMAIASAEQDLVLINQDAAVKQIFISPKEAKTNARGMTRKQRKASLSASTNGISKSESTESSTKTGKTESDFNDTHDSARDTKGAGQLNLVSMQVTFESSQALKKGPEIQNEETQPGFVNNSHLFASEPRDETVTPLKLMETKEAIDISENENVLAGSYEQNGAVAKSETTASSRSSKKANRSIKDNIKTLDANAADTEKTTVSIGIFDDISGRVEGAEDFLTSRLLAILDAGSNDAHGNLIIFI